MPIIRINAIILHGDSTGIRLRAMAALQLKVPEPFDFKKPEEWPRWKKRFEQYRIASGLGEESDQRQISTLLYCLGEEADDVLSSTNITETQRRRYSDVLSKFDSFFHVTKNVIFERARFNRRVQQEGESVEQYIAVGVCDNEIFIIAITHLGSCIIHTCLSRARLGRTTHYRVS